MKIILLLVTVLITAQAGLALPSGRDQDDMRRRDSNGNNGDPNGVPIDVEKVDTPQTQNSGRSARQEQDAFEAAIKRAEELDGEVEGNTLLKVMGRARIAQKNQNEDREKRASCEAKSNPDELMFEYDGKDAEGNWRVYSKKLSDVCQYAHNRNRKNHVSTPNMVWDYDLACDAQMYAERLGNTDPEVAPSLVHDPTLQSKEQGENLFMGYNSIGYTGVEYAVKAWYNEIKLFNFEERKYTPLIGHFSQVVWKDTEKVGCGIYKRDLGGAYLTLIVARYWPPGNYVDELEDKVDKLKSKLGGEKPVATPLKDLVPGQMTCIDYNREACGSTGWCNYDFVKPLCQCTCT